MSLMGMLPAPAYHHEVHVAGFQNALETQTIAIEAARDDMKLQTQPSAATWGMAYYERQYGLAVDESKPMDQRLAAYRSRRRQLGTTTEEVIRNIAEGFYNGEVAVVEHKREFWCEVIFLSLTGVPPNLPDLQQAIGEVTPAHMEVVYVVVWNIHNVLAKLTHGQLAQYTHDELRTARFFYNQHSVLSAYTHGELAAYTHKQLRNEVLR